MKITWYGHAAFLIETATAQGEVRVIMDPFSSRTGYDPIHAAADVVTLSHDNPKYHSCLDELQGAPEIVHGLEIIGRVVATHGLRSGAVPVFESYDFEQDRGEGPNTMIWLEAEGLRVLHMGDVGHALDEARTAACGQVDILLAPTGGTPTIQLPDLQDFIARLRPAAVRVGPAAGELDGEGGALAFAFAVDVHAAAVQFDQVVHDREAQTQTAVDAGERRVALAEAIEDMGQELRADALAGVAHRDVGAGLVVTDAHFDTAAARRELDGVGEQVQHDLLEAAGVARYRAEGGIRFGADLNVSFLGQWVLDLDGALDHAVKVHRTHLQADLARDRT